MKPFDLLSPITAVSCFIQSGNFNKLHWLSWFQRSYFLFVYFAEVVGTDFCDCRAVYWYFKRRRESKMALLLCILIHLESRIYLNHNFAIVFSSANSKRCLRSRVKCVTFIFLSLKTHAPISKDSFHHCPLSLLLLKVASSFK